MIIRTKMINEHLYESDAKGKKITLDTGSGEKNHQSPTEVVLSAIASCSSVDVVEIIRKKRKDVTSLEVITSGDRKSAEEGYPRIYKNIHLNFILESKDASENDLKQAVELSIEKYCSVAGMLSGTAKITYAWELKKQ